MTCTLLITTAWNLVMIHIIIIIITILTHRVHATPSLQCLPACLQPPGTYLPTCMYICTYVVTTTTNKQTTTNSTTCMSHSIRHRERDLLS